MASLPVWAVSLIITAAATGVQLGVGYLLRPKQDNTPLDRGKNDDVRVTGSEYGAFIYRYWGKVRLGGTIIWTSGITHEVTDIPAEGGKKGGGQPSERLHQYYSSFGWLIARSVTDNFYRVWADENVLAGQYAAVGTTFQAETSNKMTYKGTVNVDYVKDTVNGFLEVKAYSAVTPRGFTLDTSGVQFGPRLGGDPEQVPTPRTKITFFTTTPGTQQVELKGNVSGGGSATQTATFNELAPSGTYAQSTYTFDGNIASFEVTVQDAGASNNYCRYDYFVVEKVWEFDNATGAKYTGSITGIADPNAFYQGDALDLSGYYNYQPPTSGTGVRTLATLASAAGSSRQYRGLPTQPQDSALIDYLDVRYGPGLGGDYAPAHRGMTMMVFENFELTRGRVPNFTIELENSTNTVNQILTDLAADVGLVSGDLVLTATNGLSVFGYAETKKESRKNHWEYLGKYWGFRFAEIDGKITTIKDSFTSVATLNGDSLRAHRYGEDMTPFDAEISIASDIEVPRQVRFSFVNPYLDYSNDVAAASLFSGLASSDVLDVAFPIVAEPEQARKQAEQMLLKIHSEIRTVSFSGMPEMMRYAVGDVVTVTLNGLQCLVRIEKKTADLPIGIVKIEGTILEQYEAGDIASAVTASELSAVSSAQLGYVVAPRNAIAIPFNSRPVRSGDEQRSGAYVAISPRGYGASETVSLYQEMGPDNYVLRTVQTAPTICGISATQLASWAFTTEDTSGSVDVWFYNDETFESVASYQTLLDYPELNLLRVGDEWVQFRTATKQTLEDPSPYRSKWRFRNFHRACFGTKSNSARPAGSNVVFLSNALQFIDLADSDKEKTVTFKAVAGGQRVEDVKEWSFTFSPVSAYTVTNKTTDRTLDANVTSINELADVVSTMIDDLNL